jgi:hypothetical protein
MQACSNPSIPPGAVNSPQKSAGRTKNDLRSLINATNTEERVGQGKPPPAERVFTNKGGKQSPKEVKALNDLGRTEGREFVMPLEGNEQAIDAFDKNTGRPIQLKQLSSSKGDKIAQRVRDTRKAAKGDASKGIDPWYDIEEHIDAPQMTRAETLRGLHKLNREPMVDAEGKHDGHITRIKITDQGGTLDLAVGPDGKVVLPPPPPATDASASSENAATPSPPESELNMAGEGPSPETD